jgi:subtilisin family serine protease
MVMALMLVGLASPLLFVHADDADDYLPDEVIVKLFQSTDLGSIASDYDLGLILLDQFGSRPIYRLQILDGASPPDRASALAADPRVVYAEPNFLGIAPEAKQQVSWAKRQVSWAKGDPAVEYAEQWSVSVIRLNEAHTVTRGAGVTVAVLDTGVDFAHPALAGRLVAGYDFVDMDADPSEEGIYGQNIAFGHGTHVAGLVALVAPEASIMPVRVLDPDGVGNIWVLAEALAYAMNPDGNPNTADGADVINLSLGSTNHTSLLTDIVSAATCDQSNGGCLDGNRGAVVIAAAGNDGSGTLEYPAAEGRSGLLAVGASTLADRLTSFSNNGSWIHTTAPGENILSSVPGDEYGFWSGTSASSPIVAGTATLIRAAYPDLDAGMVTAHLLETSANIGGPVPRRVDAAAAVGIPATYITGEHSCTDILGAVIVDNLLVPVGHTCTLNRTRVLGNIKVETGATLGAININVSGSIQADKAGSISIADSTIRGNLQVVESSSVLLDTSYLEGDVQLVKNINSITVLNNTIEGNLQCKDNETMPAGGGNIVRGNKEEQCSSL